LIPPPPPPPPSPHHTPPSARRSHPLTRHQTRPQAHEFYRHALLLLAYLPLKEMASEEALTISFDLGIAALVGEGLYNFGELLEHPVVTTLEATDFAWLAHLLRAFSVGDIDQYESLVETHHAQLAEQPALLANTSFLKEKITLMCLTETLFQHLGPAADRAVPFAAIATASKLPVEQVCVPWAADACPHHPHAPHAAPQPPHPSRPALLPQVELLLMRALSLKLIRGKIDQVDGTIAVEWVQPRVLQQPQIAKMTERLATWTGTVDSTLKFLEGETPEFSA